MAKKTTITHKDVQRKREERFEMQLQVTMTRAGGGGLSRVLNATLLNLSEGGCRIKIIDVQTGFAVGESIFIYIAENPKVTKKSTHKEQKDIKIEAKVRWALPNGSEIGCQFEKLSTKALKTVKNLLK